MGESIDARKIRLIAKLIEIDNPTELDLLEKWLHQGEVNGDVLTAVSEPQSTYKPLDSASSEQALDEESKKRQKNKRQHSAGKKSPETTLRVISVDDFLANEHKGQEDLLKLAKPMKKTLDVEEMIREQNWKPVDLEEWHRLVEELDIQEPIEQLLAQLTK